MSNCKKIIIFGWESMVDQWVCIRERKHEGNHIFARLEPGLSERWHS